MIRPLLLLSVVLISACISGPDKAAVSFGNASVYAEIADSPDEWQAGLMNRDHLAEDAGMLFVFPGEAKRSFWMKNTKMPLDIVFISANLTVVDVQSMEPCHSDPCRTYVSKEPAEYALEVNRGFAAENNVMVGDAVRIG